MSAKRPKLPKGTKVINTAYEDVPVGDLNPHPKNPRRGSVAAIQTSIDANGFYGAVVVQKRTNFILAGNHRYLAAKEAKFDTVPVIWVDVDDTTATRILLADNKSSDIADYDDTALADLLSSLSKDGQLVGSGYETLDVDVLLAGIEAANVVPDLDAVKEWNPGAVISYSIVFDNEDQKDHWFSFLKHLRTTLGDEATHAERLDTHIAQTMGEVIGEGANVGNDGN